MEAIVEKPFRINSPKFFLTYPKCILDKEVLLAFLKEKCKYWNYLLVSREKHADGSFHLHAFIQMTKSKDVTSCKHFDLEPYHPNIVAPYCVEETITYIKKDGDFIEEGTPVLKSKKKSKRDDDETKKKNLQILNGHLPQLVRDGEVSIYNYVQLRNAKLAYAFDNVDIPAIFPRKCYWIFGKAGVGKSYWVRSNYPKAYPKAQNKWWDGYANEATIIIEDFDCEMLSHCLKIWADCYSFIGEVKGGSVKPCYKRLFITSNYLPFELFKDKMVCEAITRRFTLCTIENYELVDLVDPSKKMEIDRDI